MDNFLTWQFLATYAGAVTVTGILTQYLKAIKLPTQVLSYIIALVIISGASFATGLITGWSDIGLLPLNAVIVSIASNGGFAAIKRTKGGN